MKWENIPAGTRSFAVTMYDPDAPTGAGWWHWIIFNIPSNVVELKTNAGSSRENLQLHVVTYFQPRTFALPVVVMYGLPALGVVHFSLCQVRVKPRDCASRNLSVNCAPVCV